MATEQTVYAVDDDHRFLAALERCLRTTGYNVEGYSSAARFLDELTPDPWGCLITDQRMPEIDGLRLQESLLERHIHLPIIFVTAYGQTPTAVKALKRGAADFLEKPINEQDLLSSVDQALAREARTRALRRNSEVVKKRFETLSRREREIFSLVVSDQSNKAIARQLKISPRTVEHHREHVMLKMQADSLAELITMGVLCGVRELQLSTAGQTRE